MWNSTEIEQWRCEVLVFHEMEGAYIQARVVEPRRNHDLQRYGPYRDNIETMLNLVVNYYKEFAICQFEEQQGVPPFPQELIEDRAIGRDRQWYDPVLRDANFGHFTYHHYHNNLDWAEYPDADIYRARPAEVHTYTLRQDNNIRGVEADFTVIDEATAIDGNTVHAAAENLRNATVHNQIGRAFDEEEFRRAIRRMGQRPYYYGRSLADDLNNAVVHHTTVYPDNPWAELPVPEEDDAE